VKISRSVFYLRDKDQSLVFIDADQQCVDVEAVRPWDVTADGEFLFTISAMLDPSARSLSCFVFRKFRTTACILLCVKLVGAVLLNQFIVQTED
jgi:hypothetical protein